MSIEKNYISNEDVIEIDKRYGTPVYIYSGERIINNYQRFVESTNNKVNLYYSLKANPNISIAKLLKSIGSGVEIASGGELSIALKAGFLPNEIIFSGPGKNKYELDKAISAQIKCIFVESLEELRLINRISKDKGLVTNIGIRINPSFKTPVDYSTQFGILEDDIHNVYELSKDCKHVKIIGIHIHSASQVLEESKLIEYFWNIYNFVESLVNDYKAELKIINMGGGYGIPYYPQDSPLKITPIGKELINIKQHLDGLLNECELIIELGRYLVGDAGYFMTKILYEKTIKNKNYLVVNGGMNHNSFVTFRGRVFRRNFPSEIVSRRKLSKTNKKFNIVGPLCTPTDLLSIDVDLPSDAGSEDLIIYKNVGAYGLTYSPVFFLGHGIPLELLKYNNNFFEIRKRSTDEDLLLNQPLEIYFKESKK